MTKEQIKKRIYPSVVTFLADWRKMVADVKRLKLEEISLFVTTANFRERQEIYEALEDTSVKRIPHVHARHDMRESEFEYLTKRFGTKAFTIHQQYFKKYFQASKFRKLLFIENNQSQHRIQGVDMLKKAGGLCIDLSHLFEFKHRRPDLDRVAVEMIEKFPVGCNHISAMLPNNKSWHVAASAKQFDYLATIPQKYFSQYLNLELYNSIPQQLKYRDYIADLLYRTWTKK